MKQKLFLIYIVLIQLIVLTDNYACSDRLANMTIGKIELRYTAFCPHYYDVEKLELLVDSLMVMQDDLDTRAIVLINRVPLTSSEDESSIALGIDTLRDLDYELEQTTELDTTNNVGIKLIYNYPWDEPNDKDMSILHCHNIMKLLRWAITNETTIKDTQQEEMISYGKFKFVVKSIPLFEIEEILRNKEKHLERFGTYFIGGLLLMAVFFLLKRRVNTHFTK